MLAVGGLLAWAALMWWRWIVQYNRRLFGKETHKSWPVQFEWRRLGWDELSLSERLNQAFGSTFLAAMGAMCLAVGLSGCVRIIIRLAGAAVG